MAAGRCKIVSRWTIVLSLVSLMIAQGVFLDQYFYNYYKHGGSQSFICAYLPAVALLVWQQMVEALAGDPVTELEGFDENFTTFKRLITGYHKMFTWLLYVVPSIIQYVWILSTFVEDIESSSFFGPRFLRIILCFPSGVFLLLDTIEYAVKSELNVEWWRVFDLFDTVELLQILLVDRNTSLPVDQTTKTFMLIFGSISLCFPAFSLWELQACRKIPSETARTNDTSNNERTRLVSRVRIASKLCQLAFVNVAFLVIRLVLFLDFKLDASMFVAKNIIAITVGVIEIISACRSKGVKGSQKNMNLRDTFQNPAFDTTTDGLHDTSLGEITATRSTQTVASEFPYDQQKTTKPEERSPNFLRRSPALYGDPEKLLRDNYSMEERNPCSSRLDYISFASGTSEMSPRFSSHIGAKFTKITESRSTQTAIAGIPSDQLHCQFCGSQKMSRLAAERFQNPLGYKSVLGDSRFCSPRDTGTPESDQLSSARQKTARQEQRFPMQNTPRKFESTTYSPSVTGAKESNPLSSALQQKKTREHEHFQTQTSLRESPVNPSPCGDSRFRLSSNIGLEESSPLSSAWQQRTTTQEKRSDMQYLGREKSAFGGDSRVCLPHDARAEELNQFYLSRLRTTTKQEERFSELQNFREKPALGASSRVPLSYNTRTEELNRYHSPSLDHISADNGTSEIHLRFPGFNNHPKRFSERPETESTINQRKRHDIKAELEKDFRSRRPGRNMHTSAFTVWNTRN